MAKQFQIGWFNLEEEKEFTNRGFACAAWYEVIKVPAGKYPVYSNGYNYHERDRKYTNKLKDTSVNYKLDGIIVASNFSSYFAGVMVGEGKFNEKNGQESCVHFSPYAHALAKGLLEGNTNIELLPEFEAREINFEYNGESCKTYGIFNKTLPNHEN